MIQISVDSEISDAIRKLQTISEAQQFNFAVAKALTTTASQAQKYTRSEMPKRFTLRRNWIVQGIRVERATKANLSAMVYSIDPFMGIQETGGTKSPLHRYVCIPTSLVRRTPKDLIKKSDKPKALLATGRRAEIVEIKGRTFIALKRPRGGKNGAELKLMYLLVPRAKIDPRLKLVEDATMIMRKNFADNLRIALSDAMRTAR